MNRYHPHVNLQDGVQSSISSLEGDTHSCVSSLNTVMQLPEEREGVVSNNCHLGVGFVAVHVGKVFL